MKAGSLANLSIRGKLLWITVLTSSAALIVAGLAVVAYDSITFKRQRLNDLSAQAKIIGATSEGALAFNDAKAAREYLSALAARPEIALAVVYGNEGKVFATYLRKGSHRFEPPRAEADGYRTEGDDLLLFRRIKLGNETIGTVHLRANLEQRARLLSYAGIVLTMLGGSLAIALLLSTKLQALISEPLLELTQVARSVIDRQDYSRRVAKRTGDEVGVLVDAFNQMLSRIEQREAALHAANLALQTEITEHKSARDELAVLNANLERRVAERTAELEAANKELESFAYSVSHDLRAPLRAIDGFTAVLSEGYAEKLDAQGQSYLLRVRGASQRMGHLIDDLLKLSRTARSEMNRTRMNLSDLARSIVNDLQESAPERRAVFTIASDLEVTADMHLIRTVLENLLGNAWKFTQKRAETRIELGSTTQDHQTVYFVRDNGIGFDMKYAAKLFEAFQRLHSIIEFEGTGVGLASVQRIIRRHGGRVWADAAEGHGATFYFTLSA